MTETAPVLPPVRVMTIGTVPALSATLNAAVLNWITPAASMVRHSRVSNECEEPRRRRGPRGEWGTT